MPPHPLTNFEIQKYQNESKFNGVYSKNNLFKINDGAYMINLDQYVSIGARRIAFYVNGENVTYFDSFRVEHIPEEIRRLIANKSIITNIYRIQAYDSMMRGYFCIEFIDSILKGQTIFNRI